MMTKRTGALVVLGGSLLVASALVVFMSNRAPGDVGAVPVVPAAASASSPEGFSLEAPPTGAGDALANVPDIPRTRLGETAPVPASLRIPAIGVDAPVVGVGVEEDGSMEVPYDVDTVGWYRFGSRPGQAGSAVLAAHVDLAGKGPGVFFDLTRLVPGDVVTVGFDDGSEEAFEVLARRSYDRSSLPADTIFATDGSPFLTLVTCGGAFDRSTRSYESNVVVYAVPTPVPPQPVDRRK